jgi:DNA-directed RNA polymerase specialized sigma24 family protein
MDTEGSVTRWISQLKNGDRDAAQRLWEAYFHRLVSLARKRLLGTARCVADEEDVALDALASFFRGAERGQFPKLQDRDDLWRLLFVLTVRKAIDLARREARQPGAAAAGKKPRQGCGEIRPGNDLLWDRTLGDQAERNVALVLSTAPTPEFAALVADECRRLLDLLGDESLRAVALGKMEGETNAELAARLGCVVSTVERKLGRIRELWNREGIS